MRTQFTHFRRRGAKLPWQFVFTLFFLFILCASDAQTPFGSQAEDDQKHRAGLFADSPGVYSLVIKLFTPVINDGDVVSFQLFFTGYGDIKIGKIFMTPPAEIFDVGHSLVFSDLEPVTLPGQEDRFNWKWGANTIDSVTSNTIYIGLTGGIRKQGQNRETASPFFDTGQGDPFIPQLSTEFATSVEGDPIPGEAPLGFELRTKDGIRPGDYSIDIVFTYFNGETWLSDSKKVEFKVQNFLERYDQAIGFFAFFVSLLGFFLMLEPLFKLGRSIWRVIRWRKSSQQPSPPEAL